jgi:hypothetical protein
MEIKSAYESATAQGRTERVVWSEHEITELAKAFLEERKADPFCPAHEVLSVGMRKVLPEHRHRDIVSMNAVQNVRAKIETMWLDEMTKTTPEPIICHVETQSPPDYVDILHRCDLPSLVALVVAKLGESAAALKPLLAVLNAANGAPAGAPHQAPVSLLHQASAKPRKPRVLLVGPHARQFHEIETRAAEEKLPVELLLLDRDKQVRGPINCDHVIATFVNKNLNDQLRTNIPAGKYHLLEGSGGVVQFVNKLRDIGSLLPPRA